MRFSTLAVAAAFALAAPVAAQAQLTEHERIIRSFDVAEVQAIMGELGVSATPLEIDVDGVKRNVLLASIQGLNFVATLDQCDNPLLGCQALHLGAGFTLSEELTTEHLNAFNGIAPFGSAVMVGQGDFLVQRYMISHFGVTRGNVAVNVGGFLELVGGFSTFIAAVLGEDFNNIDASFDGAAVADAAAALDGGLEGGSGDLDPVLAAIRASAPDHLNVIQAGDDDKIRNR